MGYVTGFFGLVIGYLSMGDGNNGNICLTILSFVIIVGIVAFVSLYTFLYNKQFKYINKQIELIQSASESIIIVMHSLSSENKKKLYKIFDEELEKAVKRLDKKDGVRVLTYKENDKERAEGARQINEKDIPIRFHYSVKNDDCRFIVVDEKRVAFSNRKVHMIGLSKEFVYIESESLARMLTEKFNYLWKEAETYKKCKKYFRKVRRGIG